MRYSLTILIALFTLASFSQKQVKGSFFNYTGTSTDIVDADENLDKTFEILADYVYYYKVQLDIDTADNVTGAGTGGTIYLSGSNDNVTFTTLETVTYAGTVDTTFEVTNFDNATETIASYTITTADTTDAYNVNADTTGLSGYFADTLVYPQVTGNSVATVAAQTRTVTTKGCMYRFLRVRIDGGAATTDLELQRIGLKVARVY